MKIALFSDIHANLPALEAFFDDLTKENIDSVYCLGDLVGYNIWPNEVIEAIRERKIPTLAGNYDFGVGRNSDDCGCAYKTDEDKAMGAQSIAFTNKIISDANRQFLRLLPAHIRLEFKLDDETLNFLMVHGSPRRVNEYLFEDREEKSMMRIMQEANADLLFFGHTHKPYHRILQYDLNGQTAYRHAVNIGSVGKPKDGNSQGGYVIVTLSENTSKCLPNSIQVKFKRFNYDIEKAAKAVENSILPDAYAAMLRSGV